MVTKVGRRGARDLGSRRVYPLHADISEMLFTPEEIQRRVKELAAEIVRDHEGEPLILISILKGSVVFLVDLMRHIPTSCSIDFIGISSYDGAKSSGVVRVTTDLRESIEGRAVVVVEDIIDTGLTMVYLRDNLLTRKPKSLKICALLDKPANREIAIRPDYLGFTIPNRFVVGYGLDYREQYRNLAYIGVLRESVYKPPTGGRSLA